MTTSSKRTVRPWDLVLVALAVFATACGSQSVEAEAGSVAGPGDLVHVHDLVPSDAGLLLATHVGLYRVEGPDRAVLVGDERHDLMSMTLLGEDVLVAGGHPDLRLDRYRTEGRPPFLGLATSSDGRRWEVVTLLGDADFHALTPAGTGVLAADSTGDIWYFDSNFEAERRGSLSARDIASAPDNPDVVLATDRDGELWESRDGGRSWALVENPPRLLEVEWTRTDLLVGIGADGTLWSAPEPGATWSDHGAAPAVPQSLLVDDAGTWIVADHEGRIVESRDSGASWRELYRPASS